MGELHLQTRKLEDALGRKFHCAYFITKDTLDTEEGKPLESYGLRVELPETGESCAVPHITCVPSQIRELGRLAAAGGVTPCTLRDVVEDWL